jgi:hypothetical protein
MLWLSLFVNATFGGNWTGPFLHGFRFGVPEPLEAGTLSTERVGYDGQFYRIVAHDPWLTRGFSQYLDVPRYRREKILLPALAWIAAGGSAAWIDVAYVAWSIVFCGAGVWWASRLAVLAGRRAWWGLGFLLIPATMLSLNRMLIDGPLLALSFGAIYYDRERKNFPLFLTLAAACLCRELGLLIVAAVGLPRLVQRDWRGVVICAASAMPFLAWTWWLAHQLPSSGGGQKAFWGLPPFQGIMLRIMNPLDYRVPEPIRTIIQAADGLALLGFLAAIGLAFVLLRRQPLCPLFLVAGSFALLAALLPDPDAPWYEFYSYSRPLSPLIGMTALGGLVERDWRFATPLLLQLPRLGLELASPARQVLSYLTT